MAETWRPVLRFGNGIIYAKGDERKIVTPGESDFHYIFNVVRFIRALPTLKTPPVKTK